MNITINPGTLHGSVMAVPSKSQAHRLMICAALSDNPTTLYCLQTCQDIEATAACLRAMGADVQRTTSGYKIEPIHTVPSKALLPCGDSASTLRFLLPLVGALGIDATFLLSAQLSLRPISPLWEEMQRMGCTLTRPSPSIIRCQGKLHCGSYEIDGSVSSQFISGLLFALSVIPGESSLDITGVVRSIPYIYMTQQAMLLFKAPHYHSPGNLMVEGDWSNGAFFLAANILGNDINVIGLDPDSCQGDRAVTTILAKMDGFAHIDASDIPDLVPILAVVAGAENGAVFHHVSRLRQKESDRVASVGAMMEALGCWTEVGEDTLTVHHAKFHGCTINTHNDHRIAMAAAIAATRCQEPVNILDADCVQKSYPKFWDEYRRLGGDYEQYLRD